MKKLTKNIFAVFVPAFIICLVLLFSSVLFASDVLASDEPDTDGGEETVQTATYSLRVDGVEEERAEGETVTVTASVTEGREFYSWVADCDDLGADLAQQVLTFTMPGHDVSLFARTAKGGIPDGAGGAWDEGKTHYLIGGKRVTGLCEIGGHVYFFDRATGEKASGKLVETDGELYYFYPAGNMVHGKELKIKGPGGTGYYCFGTDGRLLRNAVVAFPSDGRLSWFSGTGKRANSKTIYFYDPASASYKAVSVDEKGRIAYGGRNARAEKLSAFAAEHPDGVSPEALQLGGLSDIFAPEPGTFTSGWTDGGKKYIRDDGTYASGWCDIGKYRYYFDPATRIKTSGKLLNLGGSYYYFYPAGNMVRGKELGIKGPAGKGYYYFGTDGRLAKNAVVAFPSESRLSWYDRGGKRVSSRTIWLYSDGAASWIPVYTLADGNIKWDDRYVSAYVGLVDFSLTYPDG
ncbi:MAG: hypothetical protein IJQ80_06940, partial [Clostridia bacterium]|nr:hypothetical protein [Clostridia bacterium]